MLNLPQQTLVKIKTTLLRQQKEVEEQLKEIENDDPVNLASQMAEASESGTDSWMADVHAKLTTVKNDLTDLSSKIKNSLLRLNKGTYGKCEKCSKPIEPERLEAMPTATVCVSCSKKTTRR
jgi:RNA polymerase-binding transcription factor DksA